MPTQGKVRKPRFKPDSLVTPANGITVLRMVLTPLVLWLIHKRELDVATFVLWLALCGTDGIDGFLARRYGVTTSGAFLDPLADKFLVIGGMIVLVMRDVFWWPLVAIIAVREVGMSVYRSVASRSGVSIPARQSAKVKTVVQQVAVSVAIAPWFGEKALWIAQLTLVVATVLTVSTGVQYFLDARKGNSRTTPVPTSAS